MDMFYTHKATVEAVRNVTSKNRDGADVKKEKVVKENWLVRATNLTDLEVRLTEIYSEDGAVKEFRVIGSKEEKFDGVVIDQDGGEAWFKITVSIEEPQDNGSIKIIKENWLVQSEDISNAQNTLINEKYSDEVNECYVSKSSKEEYSGIINWDVMVNEYAE